MSDQRVMGVVMPPYDIFKKQSGEIQQKIDAPRIGSYFDRIEYPEDGDILIYYFDKAFPAKGQPYRQAVDAIAAPKKAIKASMFFAQRHPSIAIPAILFVRFAPRFIFERFFKSAVELFFDEFIYNIIQPFNLDPIRYCKMVREFRRAAFKVTNLDPKDWRSVYKEKLIETFAMILQWDDAYRYRVQDIFGGELNKDEFAKNPGRELARITILQIRRERGWFEDKEKFLLFAKALQTIMWLMPDIKKWLLAFFNELDLEKIKLDEADDYHCMMRPDYDIHFWPMEKRQQKFLDVHNKFLAEPTTQARLAELNEAQARMNAFQSMQTFMAKEAGMPLIAFYASKEGDKARIKMLQTDIVTQRPDLIEACRKTLNEAGEQKTGSKA